MFGNFRTSSLFHYTKEIGVLYSILEKGLIPNYCYEDLSYKNNPNRGIGIPMVSFCDIPLSKTSLFAGRYGEYAIALTKEWAENKRINPILYAKDENILISLGFYKSIEGKYLSDIKKCGGNEKGVPFNFNIGQKPELVALINYNNSHDANVSINGMVKRYYREDEDKGLINNYEENEWRYLVDDTEDTPWLWDKEVYNKWRGDKCKSKPSPTKALIEKTLKFTAEDIAFIIVFKENEILEMVKKIQGMNEIAGSEIDENGKLMLYTKIISRERIQKDF